MDVLVSKQHSNNRCWGKYFEIIFFAVKRAKLKFHENNSDEQKRKYLGRLIEEPAYAATERWCRIGCEWNQN